MRTFVLSSLLISTSALLAATAPQLQIASATRVAHMLPKLVVASESGNLGDIRPQVVVVPESGNLGDTRPQVAVVSESGNLGDMRPQLVAI